MAESSQEPSMSGNTNSTAADEAPQEQIPYAESPIFKGTTKFKTDPNIKNVLVTGGSGFLGSWIVRHLTLTYPYKIICFDKLESRSSIKNIKCLESAPNFELVTGDISDHEALSRCMRDRTVDTVIHLATLPDIDKNGGRVKAMTTNVVGTWSVLEASMNVGVQRFIYVSPPGPAFPRDEKQYLAESFVNNYDTLVDIRCNILRYSDVYGPHQYSDRTIPRLASESLHTGSSPLSADNPNLKNGRWLFASDFVDVLDTILHNWTAGERYEVHCTTEPTNLELAKKIPEKAIQLESLTDQGPTGVSDKPVADSTLHRNVKKLADLGWKQKVSLQEGLSVTVEWYRNFGTCWWTSPVESTPSSASVPTEDVNPSVELRVELAKAIMRPQPQTEAIFQQAIRAAAAPAAPPRNTNAGVGQKRKRAREIEDKENEELEDLNAPKRPLLGEGLSGTQDTVR